MFNELIEKVTGLVGVVTGSTEEAEVNNSVNEIMDAAKALIAEVKAAQEDGEVNFTEAIALMTSLIEFLLTSKVLMDIKSIDGKVDVVIAMLKVIYNDKEFLDNPDIPYIPEFIEGKLESIMFDYVLPGVVKGICQKLTK